MRLAVVGLVLGMLIGAAAARDGRAQGARSGVLRGADTVRAADARTRALLHQVVVGAVGSAGGAVAGIYSGRAFCELTSPCIGEDPGLADGFIGALAGSIAGTALGTHIGARLAGGRGGHWASRLGWACLGVLAGAAAFEVAGSDADRPLALAVYPIAQALVTALLTPHD